MSASCSCLFLFLFITKVFQKVNSQILDSTTIKIWFLQNRKGGKTHCSTPKSFFLGSWSSDAVSWLVQNWIWRSCCKKIAGGRSQSFHIGFIRNFLEVFVKVFFKVIYGDSSKCRGFCISPAGAAESTSSVSLTSPSNWDVLQLGFSLKSSSGDFQVLEDQLLGWVSTTVTSNLYDPVPH